MNAAVRVYSDDLSALLQEAGLVHDESTHLFVAEVLHYVEAQIATDRLCISLGGV